jgi:hypothetical protein
LGEGAGRWEVSEDGYEEQIGIPKEMRDLVAQGEIQPETTHVVVFFLWLCNLLFG